MAKKSSGGKVGRSSVTGKFVTVNYAKEAPENNRD